jgi:hypothetical protein
LLRKRGYVVNSLKNKSREDAQSESLLSRFEGGMGERRVATVVEQGRSS